jgi:hypothetical protein
MPRIEISGICDAIVAPGGRRCGHHLAEHLVHGVALLECWRCEDWHYFIPIEDRVGRGDREAA